MGFTPTGMTRYEAVNDEAPVEGLRKELSRVVVDAGVRFETRVGRVGTGVPKGHIVSFEMNASGCSSLTMSKVFVSQSSHHTSGSMLDGIKS